MGEKIYLISEAAKLVGVETHVLRYWEEELGLEIGRTEQGHRYYTEETIHMLQNIRRLKEQGIQLKAVKTLLEEEQGPGGESPMAEWLKEKLLDEETGEGTLRENEESGEADKDRPMDECAVALTGTVEHTGNKMAQFEQILEMVVERVIERNNEELEERIARILRQQLAEMKREERKGIWPFGRRKK